MNIKQKIYSDLEPDFIYDYIFFSVNLRFWQSEESTYKKYSMKHKAKALCFINLFETYQKSLEDLSAVILAMYRRYNATKDCDYQKAFKVNQTPVTYTLINYTPGEAILDDVLSLVPKKWDVINKLGINISGKINLTLLYPDIDFEKLYNFFVVGLRSLAEDQKKRLKIYNKIKHGGVIVSDGHWFSKTLVQAPAAIYADPKAFSKDDHPLVIHGLKFNQDEFILMRAGIMKVRTIIQVLLSAYLCKEYFGNKMSDGSTISLKIFEKIQMKKFVSMWQGY